jgi:hypothetical protein
MHWARFAALKTHEPIVHRGWRIDSALLFPRGDCNRRRSTHHNDPLTTVAIGRATLCAAGLTAQTQETQTTTKTRIEIKGGKDVTVIGCLERRPNGDYVLTEVRDNSRHEHSRYALVTSQDLSKHVGERLEIKGKAVMNGDGTVSVESETKTEVENGQDQETKTRSEGTTGAFDVPFLGVRSMKTLSSSCN